jgi:exopolyphosphatase/guanosine-5'-triphosphate,3'-diphosphate pyrophosphatase
VTDVVAAIDCGTNSTRLLVARPSPDGGLETLERLMVVTRLGAGVDATGRLAPDAVERTVDVLRRYKDVLDRHGARRVRMTATSAARDAANRDEFFDAAEAAVGIRPELLGGDEEARVSFRGATTELDPADGPFLVVDIGGGSTEFAVGTTEPEGVMSIDVGCVRLTEKYLESDPPKPEELSAAISVVEAYLEDVDRELPAAREARTMVGLAGTVSTVAAVELGLQTYSRNDLHHFRLARAAAEDVFRTLATENRVDRAANPGLEAARVDTIVGGCCALVAVMRFFDAGSLLVSESDILDGLAFSLLDD